MREPYVIRNINGQRPTANGQHLRAALASHTKTPYLLLADFHDDPQAQLGNVLVYSRELFKISQHVARKFRNERKMSIFRNSSFCGSSVLARSHGRADFGLPHFGLMNRSQWLRSAAHQRGARQRRAPTTHKMAGARDGTLPSLRDEHNSPCSGGAKAASERSTCHRRG